MKSERIIIDNEDQTVAFAKRLAEELRGGETVGLCGDLGAGKTFLVRALVQCVAPHSHVSSPSYVLCNEYRGERFTLHHWDLYRTKSCPEELSEPPALNEIRLIEWIDKVPELLEGADRLITLERQGENGEDTGRILTYLLRAQQ